MTFEFLKNIIFPDSTPIRTVMHAFDTYAIHTMGKGFALLVNDSGLLVGVVSDGDIRRGLANDVYIESPIKTVMNTDFIKAHVNDSPHQLLRLFENRIKQIPLVNDTGHPVDLIQFSRFTASARKSTRVIRSRAPVRISFCGGGTDMSFYFRQNTGRVLSSTINKFSYCSIRVRDDNKIRLVSRDYNIVEEIDDISQLKYGTNLDLIKSCIKLMEPDFGFELETHSEIAPGTGLGGSSAIAASVIGVLNYFRNETHLDLYHLADIAYQSERIELDIAGGWQDQYAAVFGGINLIEFRPNDIMVVPLKIRPDVMLELHYNLMLFRFGGSRKSGEIITDQQKTFCKGRQFLGEKYDMLADLALQSKRALLKGNLNQFGKLLHQGWENKKRFSSRISNDNINELYDTAIREGATGGKVLGAGGCGYLLMYCESAHQPAVIHALGELGAHVEAFDFTSSGLQVWSV